ncbi:hypothetical protein TNCT_103431 [Trichonephila clavata]|uniref:Uncharacterized protein n=1 Tax=Trichonephila clavata TaxID=2740835 RepID=A0A8X6LL12_TRICU|nr:hypothetical protein TNCT_103431 [Trichonephila clavata]
MIRSPPLDSKHLGSRTVRVQYTVVVPSVREIQLFPPAHIRIGHQKNFVRFGLPETTPSRIVTPPSRSRRLERGQPFNKCVEIIEDVTFMLAL